MRAEEGKITFRALFLGALFSALFAVLTIFLVDRHGMYPTATQVPLFPYALLILSVLLVNPFCRWIRRLKEFSKTELLMIFVMGTVSSGISTFGLVAQVVPVIGSLCNRYWNNEQTEWNRYVEPYLNECFFVSEPGIRKAAEAYTEALEAGDAARAAEAKRTLRELEETAFARVDLFRRGLPAGLRAFPGFMPVAGEDDAGTYFSRISRFLCGIRSAHHLREALRVPAPRGGEDPKRNKKLHERLERARAALRPAADTHTLESARDRLVAVRENLDAKITRNEARISALRTVLRSAAASAIPPRQAEMDTLLERRENLKEEYARLSLARDRLAARLDAAACVSESARAIHELQERAGLLSRTELQTAIERILAGFPGFDGTWKRYLVGDIPWSHWGKPLLCWGLLIGCVYLTLMTFNILIFRQWAHNEKLVYPLAELPEILVGRHDREDSLIPAIFRHGPFWIGFSISGLVLGWNLLCATELLPGLKAIGLAHPWAPYLINTKLSGLVGTQSVLFFTMIGLAFFIPKDVSFSLWFFWVLGMLQLLILVWAGYGVDAKSFPSEWWYTMNFRTAEGGGALLVFASVILFKCRKYLLCAFFPASVRDLETGEQRELRIASVLFLLGSGGIMLMLWRGLGGNPVYAVVIYIFMLVITIGLVRAVTEGGLLTYKTYVGPFHLIRHLFGFDTSWTAPSLMAPFMIFYSVLFLDLKCFIAPAMANSLKIREDLRMQRGRFHAGILLCIAVAVIASVVAALILSYSGGADSMRKWFYTSFPRSLFNQIAEMAKSPPRATVAECGWLCFGGVFMGLLLFLRSWVFWLPHPIGMIMLVNPMMHGFWFSILIGWLCKTLVTRYTNKEVYGKARELFVGLIVGELFVVMLAMIVSLAMQRNMGIDLNR